jgi:flagellar protein FliS
MQSLKINAYQKENVKSRLASANSYTIIQMLMQGAMERLARGKGCIERKDLEGKAENLSKASSIILALSECLDYLEGMEVIKNLESLYLYMNDRITDASIQKSVEPIEEVMKLLAEIKGAWDTIPKEEIENALELQQSRV